METLLPFLPYIINLISIAFIYYGKVIKIENDITHLKEKNSSLKDDNIKLEENIKILQNSITNLNNTIIKLETIIEKKL